MLNEVVENEQLNNRPAHKPRDDRQRTNTSVTCTVYSVCTSTRVVRRGRHSTLRPVLVAYRRHANKERTSILCAAPLSHSRPRRHLWHAPTVLRHGQQTNGPRASIHPPASTACNREKNSLCTGSPLTNRS